MFSAWTRRPARSRPSHRTFVRPCVEALENRLALSISAVPDTTAFPFSAVVEMDIAIHGHALSCTGVLLDSTHVLTSAHCLYDPADGGFADTVDVFAGRNGDQVEPFGVAHGTHWTIHNSYLSGPLQGQAAFDLGVVTLDRALGTQTGTFGLSGSEPTSFFNSGGTINILGYPGDTFSGVNQYFATGPARDASPQEIHWRLSDLPIEHGSSGSPVYIKDASNNRFVVGVVSEFTDTEGIATRINAAKFNWIVSQLTTTPTTPPPPAAVPAPTASRTPGVFDPATATWYLHTSNTAGAPEIAPFSFGGAGWTPVAGDWNGDGVTTIGVVAPDATWYLKNSNTGGAPDIAPFQYGVAGWIPVTGDWNGSGTDSVGMFDPTTATWYLRETNSAGLPDIIPFQYGAPGWIPVVGDWNGDGIDTVGVVDPTTETWYLRNSNSGGGTDFTPFQYGAPGWAPVAGDWNGDGVTTIGAVDPSTETWYLRNSNGPGGVDFTPFAYGAPGWKALAGAWEGFGNVQQPNGGTTTVPGPNGGSAPATTQPATHVALDLPKVGQAAVVQGGTAQTAALAESKGMVGLSEATTIKTTF